MKTILEQEDIQAIASMIIDQLMPLLARNGDYAGSDNVYDKKGLAEYLHISQSTINKLVMNKQIPHFKIQAGQSGAVRFRQGDIDKWMQRQSVPDIKPLNNNIKQKPTA